jgi:single-stranded DNA-binding protein
MTTFVGNISKAAETRYVDSLKTTVTDFNVAENYQGRNGKRYTQFYRVSIWDKRGANLEKYLTLGRPIQISGRVKAGKPYQDKAGNWVAGLEIANPQVTFITGNPGEVDAAAEPEAPAVDEIPEEEKPF